VEEKYSATVCRAIKIASSFDFHRLNQPGLTITLTINGFRIGIGFNADPHPDPGLR
jgi:hypothetical protein